MGKKKRKKQTAVRHQVYLPTTDRILTFGPTTRENTETPFCAYYGPNGETCPVKINLKVVMSLPSVPPVICMACPLHYGIVYKQAEAFLATLSSEIKRNN